MPRVWRPDSPEPLEGRALLTITPGYDYLLSGYQWANPSHITYSIAPDGVMWENGVNNLNTVFNASLGPTAWKREIARALATWEAVANINITQVPDGPYAFNTPGLTQGDPRFGDIRFGGYAFPNNDQTTLAQSYFPPPENGTGSGDDEINTAMPWAIGSNDDLFSVMLHETGLTLGLGEVPNPNAVMNRVYSGVRSGLTAGDIAGIQAIYGPRTPDLFQRAGLGTSFVSAADLTSNFNPNGTAIIKGTSLATIGDTEYFTFVAPANASGNLSVTVGTTNVSMLSPKLTLYKAPGQPIETEANPAAWGDNLTAQVTGVTPGQRYYVTVTGATNDVFSVGAFDMNLTFSTATPATPAPSAPVATPVATTPPSTPTIPAPAPRPIASPTVSNTSLATALPLGPIRQTTLAGLSLDNANDPEFFVFQATQPSEYWITASNAKITILNASGKPITSAPWMVGVPVARASTTLYIEISARNASHLADYELAVSSSPV